MKSSAKPKVKNCPACNGHGTVNGATACPMCDGNGQVVSQPFRQPFAYVVNAIVAANGNLLATKQISSESDFEWVATVATYTSANLTVQFTDGSSTQFTDNPINIALFAGTAQLPFLVALGSEPYVFGGGSVISMTFQDSSGAQNTVQLVMWGFKLIKDTPQNSSSAKS